MLSPEIKKLFDDHAKEHPEHAEARLLALEAAQAWLSERWGASLGVSETETFLDVLVMTNGSQEMTEPKYMPTVLRTYRIALENGL